jgi:hypothetical protein
MVTVTDAGRWLHAPGTDFLFAYRDQSWDPGVTAAMVQAFQSALPISSRIKTAVHERSGYEVINGLYLLNQLEMILAMNTINGMGVYSVDQKTASGAGTAATITRAFFQAVLADLGGDIAPMLPYLTVQMGAIQAQVKQSMVTEAFGTMIGVVSLMPVLNVPVTTFRYVYSTRETSTWFGTVNCGGVERYSYDYPYTVINFEYS